MFMNYACNDHNWSALQLTATGNQSVIACSIRHPWLMRKFKKSVQERGHIYLIVPWIHIVKKIILNKTFAVKEDLLHNKFHGM